MDKETLGSKIKSLRKRKGFSQEQLAEASALSLRTIQRIEKNETMPHGDSLQKLTQALGVMPDDIMDWSVMEENGYLMVMNLSALSFIVHPLLGIILPLVLWILKKDKIKLADDTGRKIISFEITWTLFFYIFQLIVTQGRTIVWGISLKDMLPVLLRQISVIGLCVTCLYLYNIILIITNAIRNEKGNKSIYVPSIHILR